MRLPQPSSTRPREPIGPLVDVVFLLLLFFLLAGTLEPAPPIEVRPPESEHANASEADRLRVLLDAEGRIGFEGKALDAETLAGAIVPRIDASSHPAARVEADGAAASGRVLALLERLRSLGIQELELVTRPRRAAAGGDG